MTQRWTDEMLDKLADDIQDNASIARENSEAIKKMTEETRDLNVKFSAYQLSTQWVVQLAFSLIASATITVIITAIFRR